MRISAARALEVLDSRGMPTLKVTLEAGGARESFLVPAGASTGKAEARELRDGGTRYGGKGVRRAVRQVEALGLPGREFSDQQAIDRFLRRARLPGNVSLGVSGAFVRVAAAARRAPLYAAFGPGRRLPRPMVNLFSGGLHGGGNMPLQDILVVPQGAGPFAEQMERVWRVYRAAREKVAERYDYLPNWVADEGGFAPRFGSVEEALGLAVESIEAAGLRPGRQMALALDVAASHYGPGLSMEDLEGWARDYPIVSIEDGWPEDDWAGWRRLTGRLGRIQLVGDDLFATNPARLRRGIRLGCANAVLVKMNQIGTITETIEVVRIAREAGYAAVVSARSGETEDATMADLAVGTGAGQIKIGSLARSERLAKYNRLLEIEAELTAAGRRSRR